MLEPHYDVLGVSSTATQEEVKDAYRRQAMKWHPDRNAGNKQEADEQFKQVAYAHQVLSDPANRADYGNQRQDADVPEDDAKQRGWLWLFMMNSLS